MLRALTLSVLLGGLAATSWARIVTYEFTGNVTSKTGIFAAETATTVSGTYSFNTIKFDNNYPWCPGNSPFFDDQMGPVVVDPSLTIQFGAFSDSHPVNVFNGMTSYRNGIWLLDEAQDRVRLYLQDQAGAPERVELLLDTGLATDGIGPGGSLPNCEMGDPGVIYDGILTNVLDTDVAIFDRANFLAPWAGVATGRYALMEFSSATSELLFEWTTFGPAFADADGDGIADGIDGQFDGTTFTDESATFSDHFSDQGVAEETGTTFGNILDRSDLNVRIANDLMGGAIASASGGTGTADVRVCGIATLGLTDGDNASVTCGSVSTSVVAGPVTLTLDTGAVVTLPTDAQADIEETAPESYAIINTTPAGGPDVTVNDGGTDITIAPGNTVEIGARTVAIDIKPRRANNCVRLNSRGNIPVAIFGEADLDVTTIDVSTLRLSGLEVRQRRSKPQRCRVRDVNRDGIWDYRCKFEDDETLWTGTDGKAVLTGELYDGTRIEGMDDICLNPPGGGH